jgi:hypothetical protein
MNHLGLLGCLSGQYRELSRISESRDVARVLAEGETTAKTNHLELRGCLGGHIGSSVISLN